MDNEDIKWLITTLVNSIFISPSNPRYCYIEPSVSESIINKFPQGAIPIIAKYQEIFIYYGITVGKDPATHFTSKYMDEEYSCILYNGRPLLTRRSLTHVR